MKGQKNRACPRMSEMDSKCSRKRVRCGEVRFLGKSDKIASGFSKGFSYLFLTFWMSEVPVVYLL